MNSITVVGTLSDGGLKPLENGKIVFKGTVNDYRGRNKVSGEHESDYFNFEVWGQRAEFVADHFTKGSPIVVSGKMESRKGTPKGGGAQVTYWTIKAERIDFVPKGFEPRESKQQAEAPKAEPFTTDDEIPF